jgi:hydroxylamine reductase
VIASDDAHPLQIYASIQSSLAFLGNADAASKDSSKLLGEALKVGANNLSVLAMLEDAHITKYGNPVPTAVRVTPIAGKVSCVCVPVLSD